MRRRARRRRRCLPARLALGLLVAALPLVASPARAQPTSERGSRPTQPSPRGGGPEIEETPRRWWPRPLDIRLESPRPEPPPGETLPPAAGEFPGRDGLVCWPHGDHFHCRRAP